MAVGVERLYAAYLTHRSMSTPLLTQRWGLLCLSLAMMLFVGWLIPLSLNSDRSLILPEKNADTLLYHVFIQKAAAGFLHGDPFLWEHREDPASLLSFFHFWPMLYGKLYTLGGHGLLLVISALLSGLWMYAVFSFARRLGQPAPYAFLTATLQTFFIVNLGYQAMGFKTQFALYNLATSEHARLYPSVTAMAFYNLAALSVAWALQRSTIPPILFASGLVAFTAYGRPFDWMVLMGALSLVALFCFPQRDPSAAKRSIWILILAGLFAIPFITGFMTYQNGHKDAYMDQIMRGNLHVKNASHYLKYAGMCAALLGATFVGWKKSRKLSRLSKDEIVQNGIAVDWLCALAASSLLVHFKTALEGGITLVGFTYLAVFSTIPWFFMLGAYFLWRFNTTRRAQLFQSIAWVAAAFALILIQQTSAGIKRLRTPEEAQAERARLNAYEKIRLKATAEPVVLTLSNGLEAASLAGAWQFYPNQLPATYTCSAPTTELLHRFLLSKLLLTGTLNDLAPLFSNDGLAHFDTWIQAQSPTTRFWANVALRYALGSNTFIFHPIKNEGELRVRKIQLPRALLQERDFVCYFSNDLREVFEAISKTDADTVSILKEISLKYRLDYIYIPAPLLMNIENQRLKDLHEVILPEGGKLWSIGTR